MTVLPKPESPVISDSRRLELIKLAREANERVGIVGEPTMTVEELRKSQIANGVRPEDNGASRELMRMRYGDDWDEE